MSALPPLAALAALLALPACERDLARADDLAERPGAVAPRTVRVATLAPASFPVAVRTTGRLEAHERATLAAKVAGRLLDLDVDAGSIVAAGDRVARVDPTDAELQVEQARALVVTARAELGLADEAADDALDVDAVPEVAAAAATLQEARQNLHRFEQMQRDDVSAEREYDAARAAEAVAQNRHREALRDVQARRAVLAERRSALAIAERRLADTAIAAPFPGAIRVRRAGRGDYLAAGAPIADLIRMDPLRLVLDVPERDAARLRLGMAISFTVDGTAGDHAAAIARIRPYIQPSTRTVVVEADVENSRQGGGYRLLDNAFVRAEIVVDPEATALAAPAAALVTFAGVHRLLAVANATIVERRVAVGQRSGDLVEITSGAAAGDVVVLDPAGLRAGDRVRAAE